MKFSFQHSVAQPTGFDVTEALTDAHFAVVNAESKSAVDAVVSAERTKSAVFVGSGAPPGAAVHVPRPIDPTRILRALGPLAARRSPPPSSCNDEDATSSVRVDPERLHEAATVSAVGSPGSAVPPPLASQPGRTRSEAKAATRGAVRRARLDQPKGSLAAGHEPPPDVLVLDSDPSASALLCDLLARFGFGVHAVRSTDEAREAMSDKFFAAYFLDISLDHGDDIALLQTIYDLRLPERQAAPEVLMVVSQLQPADRVRASLAGLGTPLLKPVGRGHLAGALESRGLALPADARRT